MELIKKKMALSSALTTISQKLGDRITL
jgi:hypothetical protein